MRYAVSVLTVSLLAGTVGPAIADIFVWRDRYGVSHYTNDLANVPPEYRKAAITVAKDWVRAEPPPEPVEPTPKPEPSASAGVEGRPDIDLFEAGYEAGRRTSDSAPATAIATSSVGPVITLMTQEPPPRERLLPVFGPMIVETRRPRERRSDSAEEERPVLARPVPAFQGPAGPPPLGAAGPPPFGAAGPPVR